MYLRVSCKYNFNCDCQCHDQRSTPKRCNLAKGAINLVTRRERETADRNTERDRERQIELRGGEVSSNFDALLPAKKTPKWSRLRSVNMDNNDM